MTAFGPNFEARLKARGWVKVQSAAMEFEWRRYGVNGDLLSVEGDALWHNEVENLKTTMESRDDIGDGPSKD